MSRRSGTPVRHREPDARNASEITRVCLVCQQPVSDDDPVIVTPISDWPGQPVAEWRWYGLHPACAPSHPGLLDRP